MGASCPLGRRSILELPPARRPLALPGTRFEYPSPELLHSFNEHLKPKPGFGPGRAFKLLEDARLFGRVRLRPLDDEIADLSARGFEIGKEALEIMPAAGMGCS